MWTNDCEQTVNNNKYSEIVGNNHLYRVKL